VAVGIEMNLLIGVLKATGGCRPADLHHVRLSRRSEGADG